MHKILGHPHIHGQGPLLALTYMLPGGRNALHRELRMVGAMINALIKRADNKGFDASCDLFPPPFPKLSNFPGLNDHISIKKTTKKALAV